MSEIVNGLIVSTSLLFVIWIVYKKESPGEAAVMLDVLITSRIAVSTMGGVLSVPVAGLPPLPG